MAACYLMLCRRLSAVSYRRPADVPQALRAATAPLPQVSSAQEDPSRTERPQAMGEHCAASPFTAFAQKPNLATPRKAFQDSSLFRGGARAPAAAPQRGAETSAAPASHTVHQDRLLPPRSPAAAGQPAAALLIEPSVSHSSLAVCAVNLE